MKNKKEVITSKGLEILYLVMCSCPDAPTNGGREAKEILKKFSEMKVDVDFEYFLQTVNAWKKKYGKKEDACLIEALYDVYAHIKEVSTEIIDEYSILDFFSGDHHAKKIWQEIREEYGKDWGQIYMSKVLFAHVLVPMRIKKIQDGLIFGVYENGEQVINIGSVLPLVNDLKPYDIVLLHYGFALRKATDEEAKNALSENILSDVFSQACKMIHEEGIDFQQMHYFIRSLKIAAKENI